jgi:hypothetical protein
MTMIDAPGTTLGSTELVQVRKSSIRDLKFIECTTGPKNLAALAATGVNDSGYRGVLQP